ncbi:hypothetical protein RHECNPAF_4390011 [Rhizobium etli CNPAF512]|nr:hypothetical protein RHECNPAF_4390011 [Rhizobium etli CNPAF512]
MTLPLIVSGGSIKSAARRGKHALWAKAYVPMHFRRNSDRAEESES